MLIGPVVIVCLGTGASAIYPLLGCRLQADWTFTATELDPTSATLAEENIRTNGLQDRITVVRDLTTGKACLLACY
jgi:23S rRNA A1618 N6-methylase RlmF